MFEVMSFEVRVKWNLNSCLETEAKIRVKTEHGIKYEIAEGNGPVNTLDEALRKALLPSCPFLAEVQLIDYKVFIINGERGTAALVKVEIVSSDGDGRWASRSESTNIIQVSLQALVDSFEQAILRSSAEEIAEQTG